MRTPDDFEPAFQRLAAARATAAVIFADPLTVRNRDRLESAVARSRVPALWGTTVAAWGLPSALISFGPNVAGQPRRAVEYVARILKGASPADLPFEQPTRFEVVINLETARALGLTIPPSLMLRADPVMGSPFRLRYRGPCIRPAVITSGKLGYADAPVAQVDRAAVS